VRGWRRLAGESEEDLGALADQVGAAMSPLLEQVKQPPGRQTGARDQVLAEMDKLVLAAISKGSTIEKAIVSVYGDEGFEGHLKRIKRARREERDLISDQSSE
jgi:hypothetical protein